MTAVECSIQMILSYILPDKYNSCWLWQHISRRKQYGRTGTLSWTAPIKASKRSPPSAPIRFIRPLSSAWWQNALWKNHPDPALWPRHGSPSTFYRYFEDKYDLLRYCPQTFFDSTGLNQNIIYLQNSDSTKEFIHGGYMSWKQAVSRFCRSTSSIKTMNLWRFFEMF